VALFSVFLLYDGRIANPLHQDGNNLAPASAQHPEDLGRAREDAGAVSMLLVSGERGYGERVGGLAEMEDEHEGDEEGRGGREGRGDGGNDGGGHTVDVRGEKGRGQEGDEGVVECSGGHEELVCDEGNGSARFTGRETRRERTHEGRGKGDVVAKRIIEFLQRRVRRDGDQVIQLYSSSSWSSSTGEGGGECSVKRVSAFETGRGKR
jgi:hypothetical protein